MSHDGHGHPAAGGGTTATVVLHLGGMNWATEKLLAESVLSRRPGVLSVEANPVSQTATVAFDTAKSRWRTCGAGSRRAATTAPASRSLLTSATRWRSRASPRRLRLSIVRRRGSGRPRR